MKAGVMNDPDCAAGARPEGRTVTTPTVAPKRGMRHAAITRDLYSYQGYRSWMHKARAGWKKV